MRRLVPLLLLLFSKSAIAQQYDYWVEHALEYIAKHPIVHVDPKEKTCLAHNIYFEARNESYEGKLAVATVTTNRVKSKQYPDTYCGVVWQIRISPTTGKRVPQFSWTLDGKSDTPHNRREFKSAMMIAEEVLRFGKRSAIIDHEVLNYHANYVEPFWADHMTMVARIDTHLFYSN